MQEDPAVLAKRMVDLMAKDIVKDLETAGYKAQRLGAMDPGPAAGAFVHGVFTELDQGNRLHRAVIGFCAGEAQMDSYVTMNDLAHPDEPFYTDSESGTSDKK